jgi:hypothetical protein
MKQTKKTKTKKSTSKKTVAKQPKTSSKVNYAG